MSVFQRLVISASQLLICLVVLQARLVWGSSGTATVTLSMAAIATYGALLFLLANYVVGRVQLIPAFVLGACAGALAVPLVLFPEFVSLLIKVSDPGVGALAQVGTALMAGYCLAIACGLACAFGTWLFLIVLAVRFQVSSVDARRGPALVAAVLSGWFAVSLAMILFQFVAQNELPFRVESLVAWGSALVASSVGLLWSAVAALVRSARCRVGAGGPSLPF